MAKRGRPRKHPYEAWLDQWNLDRELFISNVRRELGCGANDLGNRIGKFFVDNGIPRDSFVVHAPLSNDFIWIMTPAQWYDIGKGGKSYPWAKWLDGTSRTLMQDDDFRGSPYRFMKTAKQYIDRDREFSLVYGKNYVIIRGYYRYASSVPRNRYQDSRK